jgi:hypothetical protein
MLQNLRISPVTFVTAVVWTALGACVVAWGLAMWPHDPRPLANTVAVAAPGALPPVQATDMAIVLGDSRASSQDPASSSSGAVNMHLLGVAIKRHHDAVAVISIDNDPPQHFQIGAVVSPGMVLQAVTPTHALLGATLHSPTLLKLELPELP